MAACTSLPSVCSGIYQAVLASIEKMTASRHRISAKNSRLIACFGEVAAITAVYHASNFEFAGARRHAFEGLLVPEHRAAYRVRP